MIMVSRSGIAAFATSLVLLASVLCATGGSAGAADVRQVSAAIVPGAPYAETSGSSMLDFAGYPWTVKSSTAPIGPGPNLFDATGPFIDPSGALHLQIVHVAAGW